MMPKKSSFLVASLLSPFAVFAVVPGSLSLTDLNNNLAVVDGDGNLSITSSSTTFYSGNIAAHMFDGDGSTYADLNKNEGWIAVQMKSPMLLTDVRYFGRTNNYSQAKRVIGCYIQGANNADFSDAVTLHVCKPPDDWNPNNKEWVEARVDAAAANQTFTYLRIYSPGVGGAIHAGNLAELEFYVRPAPQDASVPAAPVVSNVTWINGGVGFDLAVADDVITYTVAKTTQSGVGDANRYFNFYTADNSPVRVSLPRTSLEVPSVGITAGNMAGTSSATALDIAASLYPLTGTASGAATAANAFDGDERTVCTLAANEAAVLDLGAVRTVSGARLLVAENAANLVNARIEVSQDADFFEVQTLATIAAAPAVGEVVALAVDTPLSGRFVRLITPKACSLAEVEFNAALPMVEPTSFSVARDGITNQYAVLSWTMPENATSVAVYRAPGAGGPWTQLATVSGAETYTDSTAPVGVTMYYKLAPVVDGAVGAMSSATVSHRRCRLLERDWSDMTTLKSGVTVIWKYRTKLYSCGLSATPTDPAVAAACAFDGLNSTFPNMQYVTSGRTCVGVDLGEACTIAFVRTVPRNHSQGVTNFKGMRFAGSNDGDNWFGTTEPDITEPTTSGAYAWNELPSTNRTPFRYVYAYNPTVASWNNMVAEIRFFGWAASEVSAAAIGATDLAVVQDGSSAALTWQCDAQVGTFRVERSTDGGEWTTLATGLSAKTYVDGSIALSGSTYSYRVVTVNGEAEAISETVSVKPYAHGAGVGLHAVYYTNYTSSAAAEVVALVATNAQVNVTGGSLVPGVDDATNNVLVAYSGKLIVPVEGKYRFRAQTDDAVSLSLDGSFVLTQTSLAGAVPCSPFISLAAGEHDIVLRYYQHGGDAACVLSWYGPVSAEVIPQTQFVPVPQYALPEPWEGARTFSGDDAANFGGNVRVNQDGSFDFAFAGSDLYLSDKGYTFMWQPVTGDFTFKARMEFIGPSGISGQKGGLMMRSALDAGAPFESIVMRSNSGGAFASCHCTSQGGNISQPKDINGKSSWAVAGPRAGLYLKITRRGNVFESWFRKPDETAWTKYYRYEDTKGNYGDTVYVGPLTSFITPGSYALDMNSNFVSDFAKPRYSWRFKDMKITPVTGSVLLVR